MKKFLDDRGNLGRFFHGNKVADIFDQSVRCMGKQGNGFLYVDEVTILAVFAFKHEHGAGNLGKERPWVILNAAHEQSGLPLGRAG
jgi:hypothetical protein